MENFNRLLAQARPLVIRAIADIDPSLSSPAFAVADEALEAMDTLVPEDVSLAWCVTMLSERPDLLKEPADGDTVAEVIRSAVIELVLSTLDREAENVVDTDFDNATVPTP
jgi:hypothetical protein